MFKRNEAGIALGLMITLCCCSGMFFWLGLLPDEIEIVGQSLMLGFLILFSSLSFRVEGSVDKLSIFGVKSK